MRGGVSHPLTSAPNSRPEGRSFEWHGRRESSDSRDLNWLELNWLELSWLELCWLELSWLELSWFCCD